VGRPVVLKAPPPGSDAFKKMFKGLQEVIMIELGDLLRCGSWKAMSEPDVWTSI
jgi:hypothetical protein